MQLEFVIKARLGVGGHELGASNSFDSQKH